MSPAREPRYRGAFPVVPTIFDERGDLDLDGQKRCVDFIIDAGVDGLCILANFSEQFSVSDDERSRLTRMILEHVAGRVPVIVTTSHFSARLCAERSRYAQECGAAMVMVLPPYHGATIRVPPEAIHAFFRTVPDAIDIPVLVQDAPISGTPLPVELLVGMAREIEHVRYFKIEIPGTANKLRELIARGGAEIEGPWDGEEAVTLLADLDAGATGAILGASYVDGLKPIIDHHRAGRRELAVAQYERWLPLINYENRQAGLAACKILFKEGGIIRSDALRAPLQAVTPELRAGLIETARRLDPLVLRWNH